jgi:ABC-type multidrug transport system fused ATPase/permease subunit
VADFVAGCGARWSNTHSSAPAAVTSVDLELMPGRTVAVVGESGAGKTTLSAMLLRFVELSSGRYRIGPVDARNVAGDEVRRIVGLCAQDAHIFDSTIRENLRLARPACDDDELRDALRRVRLLGWVERLPDGLDTHVGRTVNDCRKENAGGYLSPGRCWPTSPRLSSTNPPPISTNPPPTRSCATSLWRPPIARQS